MNRFGRGLIAVAVFVTATGCRVEGRAGAPAPERAPAPSPAPAPAAASSAPENGRLSGNVDVRPYLAHVAYARHRGDGSIDIKAFDRPVGPEIGCLSGELGLVDTQRTVLIQMDWPAPAGSVWTSTIGSSNPNHAGVFLMVRRGLGGSGQRAAGEVRVVESSNGGGVLFVDAATENKVGGVHGSVKGSLPFTICN